MSPYFGRTRRSPLLLYTYINLRCCCICRYYCIDTVRVGDVALGVREWDRRYLCDFGDLIRWDEADGIEEDEYGDIYNTLVGRARAR